MTFIEQATAYIFSIVTHDETVKNFPKEFVAESAKWIRSWLLKDDPKTEAKLNDPTVNPEKKKGIIETKLEDADLSATLIAELTARLKAFEQLKTTKLNVIEGGTYKIKGNTHIGTIGNNTERQADEENVIKNAQFEVGGDFRLGNTTQVVHNYGFDKTELKKDFITHSQLGELFFGLHDMVRQGLNPALLEGYQPEPTISNTQKAPPQYSSLKTTIECLIAEGKTEKAIETLLDEKLLKDEEHDSLLMQSGKIKHLNRQINNHILSNEDAQIQRARIDKAVLDLTKALK